MVFALGALFGALFGVGIALFQIRVLRWYGKDKPIEIQERVIDTIDQLRLSSFIGLPLIFAVIGYMIAVYGVENHLIPWG